MALDFFLIYSSFHIFNKMSFSLWCVLDDFLWICFSSHQFPPQLCQWTVEPAYGSCYVFQFERLCFSFFELYFSPFFWLHDTWDRSSPMRDRTHACCIGSVSLNHWTSKAVLFQFFFKAILLFS